jgi:hypothetical protein
VAVEKPTVAIERPVAAIEKPTVAIERPIVAIEKPGAATEKPIVAIEKPSAVTEKPVVAVEKPIATIEKPIVAIERASVAIERPGAVNGIPAVAIEVATDPSAIEFDPFAIGFDPSEIARDPSPVRSARSLAAYVLFREGGRRPAGSRTPSSLGLHLLLLLPCPFHQLLEARVPAQSRQERIHIGEEPTVDEPHLDRARQPVQRLIDVADRR